MADKKTTKKATKKAEQYTAEIILLGKKYTAKGDTAQEAISKLEVGVAKGMGILTVSKGDSKKERVLPMYTVQRLFNTAGISRETVLTNISATFNGV